MRAWWRFSLNSHRARGAATAAAGQPVPDPPSGTRLREWRRPPRCFSRWPPDIPTRLARPRGERPPMAQTAPPLGRRRSRRLHQPNGLPLPCWPRAASLLCPPFLPPSVPLGCLVGPPPPPRGGAPVGGIGFIITPRLDTERTEARIGRVKQPTRGGGDKAASSLGDPPPSPPPAGASAPSPHGWPVRAASCLGPPPRASAGGVSPLTASAGVLPSAYVDGHCPPKRPALSVRLWPAGPRDTFALAPHSSRAAVWRRESVGLVHLLAAARHPAYFSDSPPLT